jgi:hypothetical protein
MGIDLFNFELLGLNFIEALHDLLFFPILPLISLITQHFLLGPEWCSGADTVGKYSLISGDVSLDPEN